MALNLPYSRAGWRSLPHYLCYLLAPAASKTNWLMQLAEKDPFFASIIRMLKVQGHRIAHPYFGPSGAYQPTTLVLREQITLDDALTTLKQHGEAAAAFQFSARHGGAQTAHYFLHELVHFWQDAHGLLLSPLEREGEPPTMLDARSHVLLTCICEAMAETEALRASWRLKKAGYPIAWQGALASLDWGEHARAYAEDMHHMPEDAAVTRAFARWHASPQRADYEKRALKEYQDMTRQLPAPTLATLTMQPWLGLVPDAERFPYLTHGLLDDGTITPSPLVEPFETGNAKLGKIEHGSVAYQCRTNQP